MHAAEQTALENLKGSVPFMLRARAVGRGRASPAGSRISSARRQCAAFWASGRGMRIALASSRVVKGRVEPAGAGGPHPRARELDAREHFDQPSLARVAQVAAAAHRARARGRGPRGTAGSRSSGAGARAGWGRRRALRRSSRRPASSARPRREHRAVVVDADDPALAPGPGARCARDGGRAARRALSAAGRNRRSGSPPARRRRARDRSRSRRRAPRTRRPARPAAA